MELSLRTCEGGPTSENHAKYGGRVPPDQAAGAARGALVPVSVGEDIVLAPTGQIELGAIGEEGEARLGQTHAPLAVEHFIEGSFQPVQVGDIVRRIGELLLGEILV